MMAKKVVVAVGGWNADGMEHPIGVYSTMEKAMAAMAAADAKMVSDPKVGKPYDIHSYPEYEVD